MGTNYFVIGYDHPDVEHPTPDLDEVLDRIQGCIYDAWTVGFADGQCIAADHEQKVGLSEDHPIFARVRSIVFPPGRLHVGKSSFGWCFALATHEGIQSLADWEKVWATPGVRIEDEYGEVISVEEMRNWITKRSWSSPVNQTPEGWAEWLRQNHAVGGPNGLARHTYRARIPDEGPSATYDLCEGRFR